jgi:hypothetical protein
VGIVVDGGVTCDASMTMRVLGWTAEITAEAPRVPHKRHALNFDHMPFNSEVLSFVHKPPLSLIFLTALLLAGTS